MGPVITLPISLVSLEHQQPIILVYVDDHRLGLVFDLDEEPTIRHVINEIMLVVLLMYDYLIDLHTILHKVDVQIAVPLLVIDP